MFASLDDPTQTMDSILSYIISNRGNFGGLEDWQEFLDEVHKCGEAGNCGDKEITVQSWRKFERIVKKSIYRNGMFGNIKDGRRETRISEALRTIRKNEVHVIDIAKLNDDMQCYVFGDAVRAIYDLQLGQYNADDDYTPPSKIVVFIDELNKYAASDAPKTSPILRQVLDIAERGRSLGVVLFAAEQFKSAIHARVTGNCSSFAYGRTNAIEIAILEEIDYQYPASNAYFAYMTRGCVNKCKFCAVPKLEPIYTEYLPVSEQVRIASARYGEKKDLLLLDNNVLASCRFNECLLNNR